MRPSRPLATTLLLASLAVAGCSSPTITTGAAPAPPTTTVARTTTATPPAAPETTQTGTAAAACAPLPWPGWGTGSQLRAPSSMAPVYLIRAARHECSDQVVFHLNGPDPIGYRVRYVDVVREDGSGRPVPVAGGAALQVVINAPALGQDSHGYVGKVLAEPRASASAAGSRSASSPCSTTVATTAAWSWTSHPDLHRPRSRGPQGGADSKRPPRNAAGPVTTAHQPTRSSVRTLRSCGFARQA